MERDAILTIWEKRNVLDLLTKKYKESINERWNFDNLKKQLNASTPVTGEMDGDEYLSLYMGTVFGIFPSGKYYTGWTSNQTLRDEIQDEAFEYALNEILEPMDMWYEHGEGDPCDIFFCKLI